MIIPGTPVHITKEELLSKLSEEEIAIKYIANFRQLNKSFVSEFRIDKKPSCRLFKDIAGRLMYKDFGNFDLHTMISMIEYVAYKFNESEQAAINRIAKDFNIISDSNYIYKEVGVQDYRYNTRIKLEDNSSNLVIKIKKRDWTKSDISYWLGFYIPVEMLERNNISSISHLWLVKDNKTIFHTEFQNTHPVFSYDYYWSNGIFRRKIYRPLSEEYKWTSNTDYTIVQNYPNIPKSGDLLFIQSSYKDCMTMEILGYYAIAPNAENVWIPDEYWKKIKERWKKIIIFGNNDWNKKDNPGLNYAIRHSKKYNIPYIIIPSGETSDISDYVRKYSLSEGRVLINKLINKV